MRRYRIFISANQKELQKERFTIKEAILSNPTLQDFFDVFLFEDLPAKGKSPVTTYLREVGNADVYIGIVGSQYGLKGSDGLSATEREFRHFTKAKSTKEVLLFIKGKNDIVRDNDIKNFLKAIKSSYIYKRFVNISELKAHVLNSLISVLDEKGILSKVPFDETVCREAGFEAIDKKEVKSFLENRSVKLKVGIPKVSIKDLLVRILKIVMEKNGRLMPTNSALLFFGKNPSEYIPQHEIRIARFKGFSRSEFIDSQEINGPIYKMLDAVELFFKRNTRLANKIVEFKRVDIPEYPYEAIREALINAIAHRDYQRRGAPVIVSIFDDRVEISSPGGLLPGLNIRTLEGHHETRNKRICYIFHETKDMEKFGTGIGKMKRLMKEHGLSKPEFKEEGGFFVAKFYGPGDKILDLVPSIPKERQVDLKELGLNARQIEALRLMLNQGSTFTNRKFREIFKVTNKTAAVDLNTIIKTGMAQMRGRGRNVEYVAK